MTPSTSRTDVDDRPEPDIHASMHRRGVLASMTPVTDLEPTDVRRYVDTHARHGFVYRLGDRWVIEHCVAGDWHACVLVEGRDRRPLDVDASDHEVNMAAMRDLRCRPHRGPLVERLRGTCHR